MSAYLRRVLAILAGSALAFAFFAALIAIATVAQTYINGARVAVDFMKATGAVTDESGIIAAPRQIEGKRA